MQSLSMNLVYLFILLIEIEICLKVLKNTLSWMKLNINIQEKTSQREPMSNIGSQIISFNQIYTNLNSFKLKVRNL